MSVDLTFTLCAHMHARTHAHTHIHTRTHTRTHTHTQVRALEKFRVVCVACGSRDAQTLAATEPGILWAWGDGGFGKLGTDNNDGSNDPARVGDYGSSGVAQLECGAQFSVMLTKDGKVYTW